MAEPLGVVPPSVPGARIAAGPRGAFGTARIDADDCGGWSISRHSELDLKENSLCLRSYLVHHSLASSAHARES